MGRKRKSGGEANSSTPTAVRRSGRLKKSALPEEGEGGGPAASHVNLVEEEEAPATHGQNLEQKIDSLAQAVEEIKSKMSKRVTRSANENPSSEFTYKSLYIDAVKKIESLMEKQYESVKELEYARGKIDAYEKVLASRSEKDGEDQSRRFTSSVPPPRPPNADEHNA